MKQITKKVQSAKRFFAEQKTVIIAVLAMFFIGMFLGTVSEAKEQTKKISEKFVRFHIVANSNSEEDQCVKMKVRDAIFSKLDFSHISSKEEALDYFLKHRTEIETISNRILSENGFSYGAHVFVGTKEFPVREYSDFVLPSGTYEAVSVTLGEGRGQNFFCVMYPSLCRIEGVTESTDSNYQILNHVLTEEETKLISGNKKQIVYKFKIIELLENIF